MSGTPTPFLEPTGAAPLPLPIPPIPPRAPPPAATAPPNITAVRSPNDGVEQSGGRLWMRKWKLSVGTAAGTTALDLSLLDFEFSVERVIRVPGSVARIKIWNPGDEVVERMNKELVKVHLEAGYQQPSNQYGDLFNGQINYFKHGRQSAVDKFVEIYATEFDEGINAAVVNEWVPAGYVTKDAINAVLTALTPFGITLGQIPDTINKDPQPRGRLFFGMARDYMRDIERTEHARFFTDKDGKLHLLKESEALKMGSETVPVLNANTGLIDIPTRTLSGAVEVQCLLNPAIKPGGRIKINNKEVANFQKVDVTNLVADAFKMSTDSINFRGDGLYTVGHVRHQGQTRGNPWFSHIHSLEADPTVQPPGIRTTAGG